MDGNQSPRSLRDIIDEAITQVDTYKYPDLSEFEARLEPIVRAMNLHGTLTDSIEYIGWGTHNGPHLHIRTAYSCRGCSMSDDIDIPVSIIDHPTPITEAIRQRLDNKVKKLHRELAGARATVEKLNLNLVNAQLEYDEFMS